MNEKDLRERTHQFARESSDFLKVIPNMTGNVEDGRQLLRSSGSIGANYLEADNALSRKEALMQEGAEWVRIFAAFRRKMARQ